MENIIPFIVLDTINFDLNDDISNDRPYYVANSIKEPMNSRYSNIHIYYFKKLNVSTTGTQFPSLLKDLLMNFNCTNLMIRSAFII